MVNNARLNPEYQYLLQPSPGKEVPVDREFWHTRTLYHEREIQNITRKLKYFGGVQDEYDGPESDYHRFTMANKLRKLLEQHLVSLRAAKVGRFPEPQEFEWSMRRLGPLVQHAKLAYSYDYR